jgi:hypothetical protein
MEDFDSFNNRLKLGNCHFFSNDYPLASIYHIHEEIENIRPLYRLLHILLK